MIRRACAALCALFLPAVAVAGQFDGVYRQAASTECGLVGVDGGALLIRDNTLFGVSMQCKMTRPVDVVDMDATLYSMQCSGSGQSWVERAMFMHPADGDGLLMIWNGYVFRYERCPDLTE